MNCQEAPTASTSTAACQHVKLRLIWKIDASSQALSKLCFNDTLSEGCFSAWKQRIEKKFQCLEGSLALRYCPGSVHELEDAASLPLESEKDLCELKELYQSTFKLHSKASTYRVVVFAFSRPVAKAPLASCYGVQTHIATVETCTVAVAGVSTACDVQKTDTRPTSGSGAAAEDVSLLHGLEVRQINTKSCRNPLGNGAGQQQKKLKVHMKHTDVTSTPVPNTTIVEHEGVSLSPAQPDFCWEHILRSIVKTVDRHHFGSKLAALASAAS